MKYVTLALALHAVPALADEATLPASLTCFGVTHPYWYMDIAPDSITVGTIGDTDGDQSYPITRMSPDRDFTNLPATGFWFKWNVYGEDATSFIMPNACQDIDSDEVFDFSYVGTHMMASGCCSL